MKLKIEDIEVQRIVFGLDKNTLNGGGSEKSVDICYTSLPCTYAGPLC